MAFDWARFVKKSFENVGPRNPLKKLSESDKQLLVALLKVYVRETRETKPDNVFDTLEEIAEITAEAGVLGKRIQSKMFVGPHAQVFAPILRKFQHLPAELCNFSNVIGGLTENVMGKRGHKAKTTKNQLLVMASEFVRQKTGKPYDEHVAELLQTIPGIDPDGEDISGDAIRKKREHLKRTYPLIYRNVVDRVRNRFMRSTGPESQEEVSS